MLLLINYVIIYFIYNFVNFEGLAENCYGKLGSLFKYFLVKIIIIINKRDQAPSRVNVKKR